jgi:hypothetical protein
MPVSPQPRAQQQSTDDGRGDQHSRRASAAALTRSAPPENHSPKANRPGGGTAGAVADVLLCFLLYALCIAGVTRRASSICARRHALVDCWRGKSKPPRREPGRLRLRRNVGSSAAALQRSRHGGHELPPAKAGTTDVVSIATTVSTATMLKTRFNLRSMMFSFLARVKGKPLRSRAPPVIGL